MESYLLPLYFKGEGLAVQKEVSQLRCDVPSDVCERECEAGLSGRLELVSWGG